MALVLLGLATVLSGWLVYLSLSSGPVPGCDAGNCGLVLGSKWAKIFGVPVGLFGGAAYLVLALLGSKPFPPGQRSMRIVAGAIALLIPGAALWFVALQMFVLHAFCPWCCTTHAIASLGAGLMIWTWQGGRPASATASNRRARKAGAAPPVWGAAAGLALLGLAGLAGAQALSPEPAKARVITAAMNSTPPPTPTGTATATTTSTTTTAPTSAVPARASTASTPTPAATVTPVPASTPATPAGPRRVRLHDGRFDLDPTAYPVNGSPSAEHLIVMISDYTCPHCRAAYKILKEVREVFDGQRLGILMLPAHHGGDSQELQTLMLSTWKVEPTVWAEVASDLYLEHLPLRPDTVRQVLEQRLGPGRLDASIEANRAWVQATVELTREIHAANKAKAGSGSIPQFVIGQEIVVGAPADASEFYALFEKNLGLVRASFPELALGQPEYDLGRVFAGTGPTVVLTYTNVGRAPLQLSRATVPGGGRVARGLQVPVEPGRTGSVDVVIAVPRDAGPFEQTVTLHSNGRPAEHPVTVKGMAWRPLKMDPTALEFGRVDPESTPPPPAVMRLTLEEPAVLERVTSQNPGFEAELKEVTPGRAYDVVVRATKALPTGPQQTSLRVDLAKPVPRGWPETLVFAARALVERAVTVLPQRLSVPPGPLPSERRHQILVRCTDGTPGFAVTGAVLDGGAALAPPEVQAGSRTNEFLVRLTLPAGWSLPPAPLVSRVSIQTTHPKFPTVEVPLSPQTR